MPATLSKVALGENAKRGGSVPRNSVPGELMGK